MSCVEWYAVKRVSDRASSGERAKELDLVELTLRNLVKSADTPTNRVFYSSKRPHSSLGDKMPILFVEDWTNSPRRSKNR